MSRAAQFIFRRKGGKGWHWTDIVTWIWLIGGLFIMFGPAVWLVGSSFKSPAALAEFPPTILPYVTQKVTVAGHDKPLDLYEAKLPDGSTAVLAEVRRIGVVAQMVDPEKPGEIVKVNIKDRKPVRSMSFAANNYSEPFVHFDFIRYLWNSVFVTVVATLITLVVNSMAAFALSKYEFRGRGLAMLLILATLMVPLSVIMVPLYSIISSLGLFNSLWGVILPLTAPALAVLAIFSVVWRWNDFLWPLIVLSRKELYTLQVGLSIYSGELNVQWHFILAMTVVTMIPVVLVFVFLQRYITSGIAGTGLK